MLDFETHFNESYNRVLGGSTSKGNDFFDAFYDRFIAASPVVEEKFRNIDMASQKAMLRQSLFYLSNLFVMKKVPEHLAEIAVKHDRHHADIPPDLYHLWLECLIDAVREFDTKFDQEVELAWRMVCSQGIAFMIFMYNQAEDG